MGLAEDYVHVLSQVEFHLGSSRDLPAWSSASQSDRDHVAILDGLALLLVFTPKGDVVATSYWQSAEELILLWAKNQPVDDSNQLQYIGDLLENIKNGTEADALLNMVIAMCREKIFHRVKKLANSFGVSQNNQRQEESNLWQFDETKEPHQKLEAALKEAGWLEYKPTAPTVHVLDNFTRFLGSVTRTSESKVLEEKQVRYLSKLGDYVQIIQHMPLLLKKAGKAKITVEQVRPPAAKPIEILSGSLEVLNLRCSQIISDEITPIENWDLVTDVYQKAQPGQPTGGKKMVNFTQHCEITLALEMLARHTRSKITKSKIEIGVSKACCEWCCQYLNLLASAYPNHPVLVRASHGKQPDGWMIPSNGPKSIAEKMTLLIEEKVDDVIWNIKSRRRSDSNELPHFMKKGTDLGASKQAITKNMFDFTM